MQHLAQLFKALNADAEQEFRLTNFDVQEVSVVDQPANQEDWLVIKGVTDMTIAALKELFGNGTGEFRTKDAGAQSDAGGDTSGAAPKVKLSEAKKNEAMQSLATVINALVEVGKAINGAEVDEASTNLPDQLSTVIRSASEALAKMAGTAAAAGASSEDKNAATTKAKIDGFAQSLGALEGLIANLRQAFGGNTDQGAANSGDQAGAGAGAAASGADSLDALGKALSPVIEMLKSQGTEIVALKSSLGLQSGKATETGNVETQKRDDFAWPMNMNEDRRQKAARR